MQPNDWGFILLVLVIIAAPFGLMFFLYREVTAGCGHKCRKVRQVIVVFGKRTEIHPPWFVRPKFCPECLAKGAIKCAKCGKVILPGDFAVLLKTAATCTEGSVTTMNEDGATCSVHCLNCYDFQTPLAAMGYLGEGERWSHVNPAAIESEA